MAKIAKIFKWLFIGVFLSIFSFFIIIGFPIFVLTTVFSLAVTGTRLTVGMIKRRIDKLRTGHSPDVPSEAG